MTGMKVRVRLYGTLGQDFPDYRHADGLAVEIAEGTTVAELLAVLQLPQARGTAVALEGKILKADDIIPGGAAVQILQVMSGG